MITPIAAETAKMLEAVRAEFPVTEFNTDDIRRITHLGPAVAELLLKRLLENGLIEKGRTFYRFTAPNTSVLH